LNNESIAQELKGLEQQIRGLRIEVEHWRMHTGSTGEFVLSALDGVSRALEALKGKIK
jgi:hypothetical protein